VGNFGRSVTKNYSKPMFLTDGLNDIYILELKTRHVYHTKTSLNNSTCHKDINNSFIILESLLHVQFWVSKWLLFNANSAISWQEQVNLQWDDEVCFVLDQHTELDFYSDGSLKQQSVDRHVAPLRHIFLIPSKPVFALSP